MSKVSIRTFTYNRAAWLQETINSVLIQQGVEWEMCILDNGSSDDGATQAVLAQYQNDLRFKLFRVEKNHDPCPEIDAAMAGDYVTFLPDDDWLLGRDSLALRVEMLDANPQLGFVFSSVRGHNAEGGDLGTLAMGRVSVFDKPTNAAPFRDLFVQCFLPYPTVMFRRDLLRFGGALHVTRMQCASDWGLWTAMVHSGIDTGYLATPTVSLRQHPGQDSNIRGLKDGQFLQAHLDLWGHYVRQGHKPTDQDKRTMAALLSHIISLETQQRASQASTQLNALFQEKS